MTQTASLTSKNKSAFLKKAFKGISSGETEKNRANKNLQQSTPKTTTTKEITNG